MEQKYAADPKTAQEIHAFVREFEKRFNNNDPTAVAVLCRRSSERTDLRSSGHREKFADPFQRWHPTNITCTLDQVSAVDKVSWNSGGWSCTLQGENDPLPAKGYRLDVLVREGDVWKECPP